MPWDIQYHPGHDVLFVRVTGVVDLSSWEIQLRESVEEASRHSCTRYLADYRDSDLRMTMSDLYERPAAYARVGMPHNARIALVFPPLVGDRDFVELVTRNRGYFVRVFSSPEPALEWLTGGSGGIGRPANPPVD